MTSPGLFRRRPSTVEAWQWDGGDEVAVLICDWIESNGGYAAPHPHEPLIVLGDQTAPAKPGDWIVRDKFGEFWPIGEDIFPSVYESLL